MGARLETSDDLVIWRCMPVKRFETVLSGHPFFAAAIQFDDAFEGSITAGSERSAICSDCASLRRRSGRERALKATSKAFADLRRMVRINCWHAAEHESVAMWERYLPERACGVAVRSTVGSLKAALAHFRLALSYGEESILVRRVQYRDYVTDDFEDRSMEGPSSTSGSNSGMNRKSVPCSLRMAAEFGVPIPEEGVFVGVDPDRPIDEVRLSQSCSVTELAGVRAWFGMLACTARL